MIKKNKKADLERKRGIFLQIGIIISSLLVLILLEWKTSVKSDTITYRIDDIELETELLPVERKKHLRPPMPRNYSKINIIPDNSEIIENTENFELSSPEIEPNEALQVPSIELKQEEDPEVPTVWIAPTMPEFPGGKTGLQKYISEHLKYPEKAVEQDIQGKVFVKFMINNKGKVQKAVLINSIHPLIDNEALRIIRNLPTWQAGTQNGQAVNVWMTIPIVFQL